MFYFIKKEKENVGGETEGKQEAVDKAPKIKNKNKKDPPLV